MKYHLQIFETNDHFKVRAVVIDGEPWFVFADACRALGYAPKNGTFSRQSDRLDEDQKRLVARSVIDRGPSPVKGEGLEAPNGASMLCTNESGLYDLIIRSEKPSAKEFRKWLTSVVLPAIRRTGTYSSKAAAISPEWQPFHDRISSSWGTVPEGYFSIFREMADIIATLITQGVPVDHKTIPDIPLGKEWSKEWTARGYEHDYGPRITYPHHYPPSFPQHRSNPQWQNCYPDDALAAYRRWVRNVFLPDYLPGYLDRKSAKGDIPLAIARSALKALGVSPVGKLARS